MNHYSKFWKLLSNCQFFIIIESFLCSAVFRRYFNYFINHNKSVTLKFQIKKKRYYRLIGFERQHHYINEYFYSINLNSEFLGFVHSGLPLGYVVAKIAWMSFWCRVSLP